MNNKKRIFDFEKYKIENEKIIEDVKKVLSEIGESKGFIADGLINPKKYADEEIKIICFLSESYGWASDKYKDGVDITKQRRGSCWNDARNNDIVGLLNAKVGVTRPLASLLYLFYESINNNSPITFEDLKKQELLKISNQLDNNINLQETLEKTAWINVKKASKSEGTKEDYDEVYRHAKSNKHILQKQIEITCPDIILILSNVAFDSLHDMELLGKVEKNKKLKMQTNEYGQMILQLDHPSLWWSYESIYENFEYLYNGFQK